MRSAAASSAVAVRPGALPWDVPPALIPGSSAQAELLRRWTPPNGPRHGMATARDDAARGIATAPRRLGARHGATRRAARRGAAPEGNSALGVANRRRQLGACLAR